MLVSLTALSVLFPAPDVRAQAPGGNEVPERHVTIPYLVRAADDIEFAAADCDVTADHARMTCRIRQVFITLASFDATACVITTNGYELTFRRETPTRWVSTESPAGPCVVRERTVLDDGGGTHWTMTVEEQAALSADGAECRRPVAPPVVYSWRDVVRKLPCVTIQPGAIER